MTQTKQAPEFIDQGSEFLERHIGTTFDDQRHMLETLGLKSIRSLINQVVPESIFSDASLQLELSCTEQTALDALRSAPQVYRVRTGSEASLLDLFSPVPRWVHRR